MASLTVVAVNGFAPPLADVETERAIVGGLLLHPEALGEVAGLTADHFSDPRLWLVYSAIRAVITDGARQVDPLKIHRWLGTQGAPLDFRWVADLAGDAALIRDIAWHVGRLEEARHRRQYHNLGARLQSDALDPTVPLSNLLGKASMALDGARTTSRIALLESVWDDAGDDPNDVYLPFLGHDGVFVVGSTHLLASWWRVGKSDVMSRCVTSWLRLGHRVLVLTEESPRTWRARLRELTAIYGIPAEARSLLRLVHTLFGGSPSEFLDAARSGPEDVVIVDTLYPAIGCADEDKSGLVLAAAGPWVGHIPKAGKTLIALVHHRKADGEHGSRIAGSQRLPALFDIVLELRRDPDDKAHPNRRHISGQSRGTQPPHLVYELDDDGLMAVLTDRSHSAGDGLAVHVLAALTGTAGWLTTAEVRGRLGVTTSSPSTLLRVLLRLTQQGDVLRDPPLDQGAERRRVRWALREQVALPMEG